MFFFNLYKVLKMSKVMKTFTSSLFKDSPKVLLMGSFITSLRISRKTEYHFKKLLGSKATLFATRCAIKEADFGNEVADEVVKTLKIKDLICVGHKGGHWTELDCVVAVVRNGNEQCFYVATGSDGDVNVLQQLKNVPVICSEGKNLVLKPASKFQQDMAAEGGQRNDRRGRYAGNGRDYRAGGRAP